MSIIKTFAKEDKSIDLINSKAIMCQFLKLASQKQLSNEVKTNLEELCIHQGIPSWGRRKGASDIGTLSWDSSKGVNTSFCNK